MRSVIRFLSAVLVINSCCVCFSRADTTPPLRVTFLDVAAPRETNAFQPRWFWRKFTKIERWERDGIGDAILLETGSKNILIDGGLPGSGRMVILPFLKKRGIEKLDTIVLTHPHGDHYGGLTEVLRGISAKKVITSGLHSGSKAYEAFMEAVKTSEAAHEVVHGGEQFTWGKEVSAAVLPVGGEKIPKYDYNNNSIVIRVTHGRVSFLFTGDMEDDEERALISSGREISSRILKVGHHGSSTSTSREFLRKVEPQVAVMSVGRDNRYGLPHRSVVDRIGSLGIELYRTDLDGTVTIISDGARWDVKTATKHDRGKKPTPLSELFYTLEGKATRHWHKGEYKEAAKLFQKALAIEPSDISSRSRLAYCYRQLGRIDEAVEEYRRVLKHEPYEPYASYQLGRIFLKRDRKTSKQYFEQYLHYHPTSKYSRRARKSIGWIHYGWGLKFKKRGKEPEAIEEFQKAVEVYEWLPTPHFQLGLLYASKERKKAITELERYIELAPEGKYVDKARAELDKLKKRGKPGRKGS